MVIRKRKKYRGITIGCVTRTEVVRSLICSRRSGRQAGLMCSRAGTTGFVLMVG